ncbi:hypothetical protein C8R44DRAFT_883708 [Mycena epipterygia]|nr:hypothetical protein C8R44DRAFT_883708 [Mycena epipterygia]
MGAFVLVGSPIRRLPNTCFRAFIRRYETRVRVRDDRSGRFKPRIIISTLNPMLLESGDVLDISSQKCITICFPASTSGTKLSYLWTNGGLLPFPPRSRGFLYYHSESPSPLQASVRFRVTPDNTPSSFSRGQDLLAPWGLPWQITLPQIGHHAGYPKILQQILHENLATEEQLSQCREVFRNHLPYHRYTLFRLDSIFAVNFASNLTLMVVGDSLHPLKLEPFTYRSCKRHTPWTGSALARFEASTRPEHTGRRVVHLRIVKITQPVECTMENYTGRVLKPEEGELFVVSSYNRAPEPWAYDVDAKGTCAAALRVLWHNSGLP